ncbi:mevalonate kinase, partial [mine drainage metagenome]
EKIQDLFLKYKISESIDDNGKDGIGAYVEDCLRDGISRDLLPYIIIAGRLMHDHHAKLSGKRIEIDSEIPVSKGFASSAACSTAFTAALSKSAGVALQDVEFIDIARDGERIVHKNYNAGKIDVNTSFYGGCVLYSDSTGATKVELHNGLQLLAIDTGP